jgi:HD superfamily phosphohydrolase
MLPIASMTDDMLDQLVELSEYRKRKAMEREIASRAGVSETKVLLDIPDRSLLVSELRIGKTDVPILDGDRVRPLSRYSPLAKAIQARGVHDWAVMVSTLPEHRDEVERATHKALFG